jgi:hypothetical protein
MEPPASLSQDLKPNPFRPVGRRASEKLLRFKGSQEDLGLSLPVRVTPVQKEALDMLVVTVMSHR